MAKFAAHIAPLAAGVEIPSDEEHPSSNGHGAHPQQGFLEISVHQARGIHNICIHSKQDVYAKFMLLQDGVEVSSFSTDIVHKGGKDPVFEQRFRSSLISSHAVLRCEVWMFSMVKDYLQDQPLGVVSIPLPTLVGKQQQFQEYQLSSTELFHSPAGTISLSLAFRIQEDTTTTDAARKPAVAVLHGEQQKVAIMQQQQQPKEASTDGPCDSGSCTSTCSESDCISGTPVEFTDLNAAREDEQLVSGFLHRLSKKQMVNTTMTMDQATAAAAAAVKEGIAPPAGCNSPPKGSKAAAGRSEQQGNVTDAEEEEAASALLEHEEVSNKSSHKKQLQVLVSTTSSSLLESSVTTNSVTPTPSSRPKEVHQQQQQGDAEEGLLLGKVSVPEVVPEPRIMQEEIVDMYMKSMQQFSDALAKMQLPLMDEKLLLPPKDDEVKVTDKDGKNSNTEANPSSSSSIGSQNSGSTSDTTIINNNNSLSNNNSSNNNTNNNDTNTNTNNNDNINISSNIRINNRSNSSSSSSDNKNSSTVSGSRVFYGSRAFF